MSEKADSEQQAKAEAEIVAKAATGENISDADRHADDAGNHEGNRTGSDHSQLPLLDRPARVIAVIGVVVAIVGLIINFFTLVAIQGQQATMGGQLNQMNAANSKTDDLIKAANRQASAAETANDFTKQSLSSADRPWVGYVSYLTNPLAAGSDAAISTNLSNHGRSPALAVKAQFVLTSQSSGQLPQALMGCTTCAERVLFPGDVFTSESEARINAGNFDENEIRLIYSGEKKLYFIGLINYKDLTNNLHTTKICFNLVPPSWHFIGCKEPSSNFAD